MYLVWHFPQAPSPLLLASIVFIDLYVKHLVQSSTVRMRAIAHVGVIATKRFSQRSHPCAIARILSVLDKSTPCNLTCFNTAHTVLERQENWIAPRPAYFFPGVAYGWRKENLFVCSLRVKKSLAWALLKWLCGAVCGAGCVSFTDVSINKWFVVFRAHVEPNCCRVLLFFAASTAAAVLHHHNGNIAGWIVQVEPTCCLVLL